MNPAWAPGGSAGCVSLYVHSCTVSPSGRSSDASAVVGDVVQAIEFEPDAGLIGGVVQQAGRARQDGESGPDPIRQQWRDADERYVEQDDRGRAGVRRQLIVQRPGGRGGQMLEGRHVSEAEPAGGAVVQGPDGRRGRLADVEALLVPACLVLRAVGGQVDREHDQAHRGSKQADQGPQEAAVGVSGPGSGTVEAIELPRVFRTGNLRFIYATSCPFRYSSMTSCGNAHR